jgi:hypothetical protein
MIDRGRLRVNAEAVRRRIQEACHRADRDPASVTIVAVTKSVGPESIDALIELGFTDLGENRAVEAAEKVARVKGRARWHFIGHLQTNKARKMLDRFEVLHSLDRAELAAELEKRLAAAARRLPVFIEVNVSGEASKGGVGPESLDAFIASLRGGRLDLQGLMTMAPNAAPEATRPVFRRLRELAGRAGLKHLSMGMTNDFEIAIEEGATHVRIGTALFDGVAMDAPPTR